jgi:hypothetical protein
MNASASQYIGRAERSSAHYNRARRAEHSSARYNNARSAERSSAMKKHWLRSGASLRPTVEVIEFLAELRSALP